VTTFSVWAPKAARSVELVLPGQGRLIEMTRGDRDWWAVDVPDAGPVTDYQFSLDGGPALPDPRSQFQPDAVHGPSRVVDHGAFPWTDQLWRGAAPLSGALIYEAHIGTFTPEGTFEAAIERLPHLVSVGVTHLELLPVVEFPGTRGWGYDGVDLFAPHHAYGGPDGLKRLVDAAHAAGLGVILDVVYNHLGPDGNYLGAYGPYFTGRYNTPWGEAVNYDGAGSDEVRDFVGDNACAWLEHYHADGLRLDAVHAIFDTSAVHILEELAGQVGNRAGGERSSALMSTGRLHIAAALVLCAPFVPMLFQGEEWGATTPFQYFTDHVDAELGRLVSEGRRKEFAAFGWQPADVPDPQDRATFDRSVLDWAELDKDPHAGLLEWHRALVAL